MAVDQNARNRIIEESRMKSLMSGLGETLVKGLGGKKESDGLLLNVKFKDEGNTELTSSLDKISQAIVVIFNHLKSFSLPKIFKVQGTVDVDSIADLPPVHIQNFKDIRPYFESLEKSLKYLSTAITLVASKTPVESAKLPNINFDTKPLLEALHELRDVSGKNIEFPSNKSELQMLRNISEGIGALVERPTFVPPAVTHTSINALQGVPFTTAVTVTSSATPLPATPLENRRSVLIFNNSANTVYLGGSGVTTSNGLPIAANSFSPILDLSKNSIIYGIASTGSEVRVFELSDEASGR